MSTRVTPGVIDFTGTTVNTLQVGRTIRVRPAPVHETQCTVCNTRSTATYTAIRDGSARCKFSGCGKTSQSISRVNDPRNRVAERIEAERIEAERLASSARMESETATYRLASRRQTFGNDPEAVETERQRLERRAWAEQMEAERLEAERPAREAERKQQERIEQLQTEHQNTLRQLHTIDRERVANGKDEAFVIDPATTSGFGTGVPPAEIEQWHKAEMRKFINANPEYHPCPENVDAILAYIDRQVPGGLKLLSAVQIERAYKRLNEFGLLKQRPAPAPKPAPAPRVNLSSAPEPPKATTLKDDGSEMGWDWTTGQPLTLTRRQVERLSATEYREFKKLDGEALSLRPLSPIYRGDDA